MRALNGIEVLSPADAVSAAALAVEAIKQSKVSLYPARTAAQDLLIYDEFIALQGQGFVHLVCGN